MKLITFDIETWGLEPGYTLQPWQAHNKKAGILSIAASDGATTLSSLWLPCNEDIKQCILNFIADGEKVILCGWNLKFDLSFLCAVGLQEFVHSFSYLDGMLLLKRIRSNLPSYSLKKVLVEYKDKIYSDTDYSANIEFKSGDPISVYSSAEQTKMIKYNKQDALYTHRLIKYFLSIASKQDVKQAVRESNAALLFADSWQKGLYIDVPLLKSYSKMQAAKIAKLEAVMTAYRITPEIIRSPQKLSTYLQEDMQLTLRNKTPSGHFSTDKKSLKNIYYSATGLTKSIIKLILLYKEAQVEQTKFVASFEKCTLDGDVIHPEPILNSTYTGRMTYSTSQSVAKTIQLKNGATRQSKEIIHIGVPIHQIKKRGFARRMFITPKDHTLVEIDFCAQEMRLMACVANEKTMLKLFSEDCDLHAYTAAGICNMPYDAFLELKTSDPEKYTQARFLGKLTNLSLQYRLSARSLHRQWHDVYGLTDKTLDDAQLARDAYLRLYPAIPAYWQSSVCMARSRGYTQNMAGRKYAIIDWDGENEWRACQTAINFPIQSTGAEQKILAIASIRHTLCDQRIMLAWDLHDGLYFYVPSNSNTTININHLVLIMSNLNYEQSWGWNPQISFPVEAKRGSNWGALSEI